jgi:hypothetical protein
LGTGAQETTVTVVEEDLLESACDTALTVTLAGFGTIAGATYSPDVETLPTVKLPPIMPFTFQTTFLLVEPLTGAASCTVSVTRRVGATFTVI